MRILTVLLIIILSFPINSMAQGYVPKDGEQLLDKVVAVVGNEIILLSDLRQQINKAYPSHGALNVKY